MATQAVAEILRSSTLAAHDPAPVATQVTAEISRSSALPSSQKPALMAAPPTQELAEVPPFTSRDYHLDVQISIHREGGTGYKVEIIPVGRTPLPPYYIDLLPHTLAASNERLQELMQAVATEKVRTETELEKQLRLLAEEGHVVFKRVFRHHCDYIAKLLAPDQRAFIQITSEDFFLPWELIYPVSLNESLSYGHFWGMNHIIYHAIRTNPCPGAYADPDIPADPRLKLGLLTYSKLTSVKDKEIPFFEKLNEDGKIHLLKLRPLDPKRWLEELGEFIAFWQETLGLAHFACHAFYKDELPNLPGIQLSDEFPILLREMEAYDLAISGHPLIIMNACETGNINPLYTSHFVTTFLKHGARGVVATECEVPDDFAADFAKKLYAYLLRGRQLGESLWATRRYFWEKHHNPSGLLYSMYAPPLIRISQRLGG